MAFRYEDLFDQGVQGVQTPPKPQRFRYEDLFKEPEEQEAQVIPPPVSPPPVQRFTYEDLFKEPEPTLPVVEPLEVPESAERGQWASLPGLPSFLPVPKRLVQAAASGAENVIAAGGRFVRGVGEYLQEPREISETSPVYQKYGIRKREAPAPDLGTWLEEKGQSVAEAAQKRQASIPRPTVDFMDENAPWQDRLDAFAYTVTEGIVSSLPSLAGGVAGFAVGNVPGAIAGATLPSYIQNKDELQQMLESKGVERDLADRVSAVGAIPIAALDAAPVAGLIAKIGGRKAAAWALKTAFRDVLTQIPFEGLTEGTQDYIAQAITQLYTGTPISWQQVQASGLIGAGVGGVMGAGGSAVGATRMGKAPQPTPVVSRTELQPPETVEIPSPITPAEGIRRFTAPDGSEIIAGRTGQSHADLLPESVPTDAFESGFLTRDDRFVTTTEASKIVDDWRAQQGIKRTTQGRALFTGDLIAPAGQEASPIVGPALRRPAVRDVELESALAKPPRERIAELEGQYPELKGKSRAELDVLRQGPAKRLRAPQALEQAPSELSDEEVGELVVRAVTKPFTSLQGASGSVEAKLKAYPQLLQMGDAVRRLFPSLVDSQTREALRANDYLGFSSAVEAASAILENPDWTTRWEADANLQKVGAVWRSKTLTTLAAAVRRAAQPTTVVPPSLPEAPRTLEQAPEAPRVPLAGEQPAEGILGRPEVPTLGTTVPTLGAVETTPPAPPSRRPPAPFTPEELGPISPERGLSPRPPEPLGEVPESGLTLEERRRESAEALRRAATRAKGLLPEYAQRVRETLQGVRLQKMQVATEQELKATERYFAERAKTEPFPESRKLERGLQRLAAKPIEDLMPEEIDALTERVGVLTQLSDLKKKLGARQEFREAEWEAEAISLAREYAKAVGTLRRVVKRATKTDLRPEYQKVVTDAIDDIDLGRMSPRVKRAAEKTEAYFAERAKNEPGLQIPESARKRIQRVMKRSVGDMSAEEVADLTEGITMAVHLSKTKNTLLANQRERSLVARAKTIVAEIVARRKPLPRPGGEKAKRGILGVLFREGFARPEEIADDASPTLAQDTWERVGFAGYQEELRRKQQMTDALLTASTDAGFAVGTRQFESWRREKVTLQTPQGPRLVTRGEALGLYLQSLSQKNVKKASRDGLHVERLGLDNKFLATDDVVRQLATIVGEPGQQIAAAAYQQYNGPMKHFLNEAWVSVYGTDVATVDDYVPQSVDPAAVSTEVDPVKRFQQFVDATLTSWGHLKQRTGSAAPIKVRDFFDDYLNQVSHVARISANLAAARDAYAILEDPTVYQAVIDRLGEDGYQRIHDSITMQVVPPIRVGRAQRWVAQRLRMFGSAVLGARLSVILSAPANLFVAAGYNGPQGYVDLAKATTKLTPKNLGRIRGTLERYAPYWRERYEQFLHETTGSMIGERETSLGPSDPAELSLVPLTKMDQGAALLKGLAAEEQVAREQPDLAGEAFEQAVADAWTKSMFRSDNTAHGMEMSGALATARRNVFFAPFIMFANAQSKVYSLGLRAINQARRGETEQAIASAAGVALSTLWMTVGVRMFVGALRGDRKEKDESFVQEFSRRYATELAGLVPILGQSILVPTIRRMLGDSGAVYPANAMDDVLQRAGTAALQAGKAVHQVVTEGARTWRDEDFANNLMKFVLGTFEVGSQMAGVPFAGMKDFVKIADNWIETAPEELQDTLRSLEKERDVREERGDLLESVKFADTELFRQAVSEINRRALERQDYQAVLTPQDVLAGVDRPYAEFQSYAPGKPDRAKLSPRAATVIDQHLADQRNLQQAAREMIRANADLFTGTGRIRQPRQPRQPRTPQ